MPRSGAAKQRPGPSLLEALGEEQRPRTAREELRLLWWYERWRGAPTFAIAAAIALATIATTATLSVIVSRTALGDSIAASYLLWGLGLAAGAIPPFLSRRWPARRPITGHLEKLEAHNPTRLIEFWLRQSAIPRASNALHRAGFVMRNGALVGETQRLPERPDLTARFYVQQPKFRTTTDDIAQRVRDVLEDAGVSARVGGHDIHGPH